MRGERWLLRMGEFLVGRAARRLPAAARVERYQEWAAELPVILGDPEIKPAAARAARMLWFAADTLRGAALGPGPARRGGGLTAAQRAWARMLNEVASAPTRIERTFDPEAVRQLKADSDLALSVNGPHLAAQAIRAGLVDEYQLFVGPAIVGGGNPFFPDDVRVDLELLDERRFGNGAGIAMALKLSEPAHIRWRAVNAPWPPRSASAPASKTANASNDPTNQEAPLKPRDTSIHRS